MTPLITSLDPLRLENKKEKELISLPFILQIYFILHFVYFTKGSKSHFERHKMLEILKYLYIFGFTMHSHGFKSPIRKSRAEVFKSHGFNDEQYSSVQWARNIFHNICLDLIINTQFATYLLPVLLFGPVTLLRIA